MNNQTMSFVGQGGFSSAVGYLVYHIFPMFANMDELLTVGALAAVVASTVIAVKDMYKEFKNV